MITQDGDNAKLRGLVVLSAAGNSQVEKFRGHYFRF